MQNKERINMEKIRIQDDLYHYVNQEWLEKAVIPDDKPTAGGFADLAVDVEKTLIADLNEMCESGNYPNAYLERACNLYKAFKDVKKKSRNGARPALKNLKKIKNLTGIPHLNRSLKEFVLQGYPLPFSIAVEDDMKDSNKHCLYLQGPSVILPDTTYYKEGMEAQKEALLGIWKNMVNVKDESERGDDEIAVYYAYGDIVQTSVGGSLSNTTAIVGADVCRDLEKLAKDDDVKAVVIRVNSGGGSAYASEQIWHQVELLRKEKPVVVSMGGKAASGGYYMSCNSSYIFAEPTTLTGSIGIFGIVPDNSELLTQKLGLKFDAVKTNRNSLFGTSSRPMNDEEIGYLTASIGRGYELFRKRVADGRKMTVDQVEAIAQGHVFTGEDALKIKLVDELGGLDKAVAKAAQLAKAKSYYTRNYPEPTDFWDQLMNETSGSYLDGKMRAALGVLYEPVMMLQNVNNTDRLQARLPYWINVK